MKDAKTITNLFNTQNHEFITEIITKYGKKFINLGNYIKRKNFVNLPYEDGDFESVLYNSIKAMKNVKESMLEKYDYLTILKKIFVQQIIALNRYFASNKQKVLTNSIPDNEFANNCCCFQNDFDEFNQNYDLKVIYQQILNRIKSPEDQKIFKLYLLNTKPKEIAKIINQPPKKIYNSLFAIKNICSEYKYL
ncbi:MAG: hypothetical protein K2I36_02640 [Ureaplasma sp.]|nr:hypothetical protein [Ureaplasma sp.]